MAEALKNLLGDAVIKGKEKTAVETASLAGQDKVLGLYFSAHWCPPCRGFTPKLAEFYKKFIKSDKGGLLEIVFISSDRDEKSFTEYYNEMPWLALPFSERDRKNKISKKYKVSGIPTLVFLDAANGRVITKDGRSAIMEDPNGANFPWRPKSFAEQVAGKFIDAKNVETDWDSIKGKVVALYFSAHWCPPCKAFTPQLAKTYNKLKSENKPFEVIFLSSDRSQESFKEYLETMPWVAIPFGDDRKASISRLFGVEGIPTLIILDENGKVITTNGRGAVSSDPEGKEFPWKPKPLNKLDDLTASMVNEEACLIYFTDGEESTTAHALDVLNPSATSTAQKAEATGDDPSLFFFYAGADEIADNLRDFAHIPDEDNILVILDIPAGKVFVSDAEEVTKDVVQKFVKDYENEALQGRSLR